MTKKNILTYIMSQDEPNINLLSTMLEEYASADNIDTSDATATVSDILNGMTAYVNDEKLTGTYVPLDTSDADAVAGDIALGKTAYVNGVKITGTYEASAE